MSNHFLTKNADNEHVCRCGYRPAIFDDPAPVGRSWMARTAVREHVNALSFKRSPQDPFDASRPRKFPRAGVRRGEDGNWVVTLWDEEGVMHAWENEGNAEHNNRIDAFDFAQWFIKPHRDLGVRLNGMASA
ncbi:hypothetical protein HWD94_04110 [Pseudarthrobacter equi]|uniref:hypothetical protein n=1 Tax=Pseudarthrobacter equi TaxID=728066 RepID=UPI0021C11495|nr:hypothetical protein [Pseudarthrobacter equi]MCT9624308.1 hypothetical protein [Pseudarthrobacter equi]